MATLPCTGLTGNASITPSSLPGKKNVVSPPENSSLRYRRKVKRELCRDDG